MPATGRGLAVGLAVPLLFVKLDAYLVTVDATFYAPPEPSLADTAVARAIERMQGALAG